MKTTMKNTVAIIMLVLLPALTGAAQAGAVEYKSTYKQSAISYPPSGFSVATTATAPTTTFQSTSAYSDQWSGEQPSTLLNSDGSVNAGAYMGGKNNAPGMRKAPGTPTDDDEEEEERQPLGDAALPLLLLACAYAIYKVSRRRKEA